MSDKQAPKLANRLEKLESHLGKLVQGIEVTATLDAKRAAAETHAIQCELFVN